jgi:hypothetical protein
VAGGAKVIYPKKKGFLVSVGVRKIPLQSDNASHQCSQPDFLSLSLSHSSQRQRLVEIFPHLVSTVIQKKPQNEIVNVGRKAAGAGEGEEDRKGLKTPPLIMILILRSMRKESKTKKPKLISYKNLFFWLSRRIEDSARRSKSFSFSS